MGRVWHLLWFLLLALWASASVIAQQKVHPLYLEKTRWVDYTHATLRDSEGFLWIGTDEGLKRYDGYELRTFVHDHDDPDSIGSGAIRLLIEHSGGDLWTGGYSLSRYDRTTETFDRFEVSGNRGMRALYEDAEGYLWIGGEGFGLRRFDPRKKTVVEALFAGEPKGNIWNVAASAQPNKIWIASDAGIYLFDTLDHSDHVFSLPINLSAGFGGVHGMVEDNNGHLWVATFEGLFVLNPINGTFRHYSEERNQPNRLATALITSVAKDAAGQIWVGTDKLGAYRYRPETDDFYHYASSDLDQDKFPLGAITHISEDHEGHLWFSVGHYGVFRLSPHLEKFTALRRSFDSKNSLSLNNVLDLHEDRNGMIWIGTDGGGLNRFNPVTGEFRHYVHDPADPTSLSSNSVLAIAEDSTGILWLGTWGGGLVRFDPETGAVSRLTRSSTGDANALADNIVFRIQIDTHDRLLMSIWDVGLQIYDVRNGRFALYTAANGYPRGPKNRSINDLEPAGDGDYWIGGYNALERFSSADQAFKAVTSVGLDSILDVHRDAKGLLWIATEKGLIRFHPLTNEAVRFTKDDGLPSDYIVGIEQDLDGHLWLATRDGLSRFDPRTKDVWAFDEHDGLAGKQFNRHSHLVTRSGKMYFGGSNGLTVFDPADLPENHFAPKVHLTSLDVNLVRQGLQSGLLEKVINYADTLVLSYHQRDLTLHFTATSLVAPSQNKFRYRLLGFEDEWTTHSSDSRRVRYSNLSPGEYRFQILAANNDGVWSGRAKELKVMVMPAWWQTWWAIMLYGLILLVIMYLFSYWRLRANRRQQAHLETLVGEQTAKLKDANRAILQLNTELEQRVVHRTRELSQEIEERRESERKANYIAYHDALTGFYNRPWLLSQLNERMRKETNKRQAFALVFIGGDRFRKINDTYGHLIGDRLLMAAAQRLSSLLPEDAHAVRLGSDEFTLLVDRVDSFAQIAELSAHIVESFKELFEVEQLRLSFSVSVGVVIADGRYTEASQILRNANIAMQHAKAKGRGLYQIFDEEILQQTLDAAALEADLKRALALRQFRVVYQPIVNIATGCLSSYEVLLRWQHPERGFVPPDKFIPLAESQGLIFDIGLWVLRQACEQLREWKNSINPPVLPGIAVNLSPLQLERPDLLERFDDIFQATGIDRSLIKFEITESALMKHTDTVDRILESLRERGIELAIDDFGTGYSSLSYLDKLPVQVLKVDRSFVNGLTAGNGKSVGAQEIVRATISLAHNLKMRVVAEGIETNEQLQALKSFGCDYGQGYFIARPLAPEAATAFLMDRM